MQNVPRRHHYVPQMLLAHFTEERTKEGWLHALKVSDGSPFKSHPNDLAQERDFYRVDGVEGVEPTVFERQFGAFESKAAPILREIIETRVIPQDKRYSTFINFVSLMAARVPATRENVERPMRKVAEMIMQMMVTTPEIYARELARVRKGEEIKTEPTYEEMREFVESKAHEIVFPQA